MVNSLDKKIREGINKELDYRKERWRARRDYKINSFMGILLLIVSLMAFGFAITISGAFGQYSINFVNYSNNLTAQNLNLSVNATNAILYNTQVDFVGLGLGVIITILISIALGFEFLLRGLTLINKAWIQFKAYKIKYGE